MGRRRAESRDTSQPLRKQDMLRTGRNKDRREGEEEEGKEGCATGDLVGRRCRNILNKLSLWGKASNTTPASV